MRTRLDFFLFYLIRTQKLNPNLTNQKHSEDVEDLANIAENLVCTYCSQPQSLNVAK